jgi:hypothetical protein
MFVLLLLTQVVALHDEAAALTQHHTAITLLLLRAQWYIRQ